MNQRLKNKLDHQDLCAEEEDKQLRILACYQIIESGNLQLLLLRHDGKYLLLLSPLKVVQMKDMSKKAVCYLSSHQNLVYTEKEHHQLD